MLSCIFIAKTSMGAGGSPPPPPPPPVNALRILLRPKYVPIARTPAAAPLATNVVLPIARSWTSNLPILIIACYEPSNNPQS